MIEIRKETNAQFRLKVGRGINGLGLFALEAIPKGKRIIEYVGRVLSDEPEEEAPNNLYIFSITPKLDIDGSPRWNTARYINHSCTPNAESETKKGHVWIKSKRKILPGEEIFYDYGKEYWKEYIKTKGCRCTKCIKRKVVKKTTEN